jgi:acyl transferase domain-containing protein
MMDLAYTLNMNRTRWGHRAFAIARDAQATAVFDQSAVQSGVALPVVPEVGFLFTGQGVSGYPTMMSKVGATANLP